MSKPKIPLADAAELANVSTRTLRRRIQDGTLRATRLGPRLIFIDPEDLDAAFRPVIDGHSKRAAK